MLEFRTIYENVVLTSTSIIEDNGDQVDLDYP